MLCAGRWQNPCAGWQGICETKVGCRHFRREAAKVSADDLSRTDAAAIQRLHPQPLNDAEGVVQRLWCRLWWQGICETRVCAICLYLCRALSWCAQPTPLLAGIHRSREMVTLKPGTLRGGGISRMRHSWAPPSTAGHGQHLLSGIWTFHRSRRCHRTPLLPAQSQNPAAIHQMPQKIPLKCQKNAEEPTLVSKSWWLLPE